MGLLKVIVSNLIVIFACFMYSQSLSSRIEIQKKYEECFTKCGGHDKVTEDIRKGDSVCVHLPEEASLDPLWPVGSLPPCMIECLGYTAAENQTGCLCKYCLEVPHAHTLFCTEPGQPHIGRGGSDCNDIVCTGNAKVYAEACVKQPDDHDSTQE